MKQVKIKLKNKALEKAVISREFELQYFKLCFVKDNFAYFTTKPLSEQWGDDWNDVPYEYNAGTPYENDRSEIIKVAYTGNLSTPSTVFRSSNVSVEDINSGSIAWLRSSEETIEIMAGATLEEFIYKVKLADGDVYMPSSWFDNEDYVPRKLAVNLALF